MAFWERNMQKLCLILFCILCLCGSAAASDLVDSMDLQSALEPEAQALLDGIDLEHANLTDGIRQVLEGTLEPSGGYIKSALAVCGQMLAVCILCSVVSGMEQSAIPKVAGVAGALAVSAIGLCTLRSLNLAGTDTLDQLRTYCDTLLPALAMTTASCGGISAASTLYVGSMVFVDLLVRVVTVLLQPLVYIYLALACAGAAIGNKILESLQELVGWLISTSLKTILFVFTAYLTISGAISGNADATTVKAAKLTLSGVVPVVGSMISDASETLVVSASILRNSIGIFGMLAVLAICGLPFLQALIRYLVLKLTAAVSSMFDISGISAVIGAFSRVTGYLLAMTGTCALMLMISFVCYIKVVVC